MTTSAFGVELGVVEKSAGQAAALAGGVIGASAGINEGVRRHYNKKGANISVKDQYRHPYRSQYAQGAAALRHSAGKKQAKADATGSERAANSANMRRFMSAHRAGEAQKGSLKHYKDLPKDQRKLGTYRYDKKKHYEAPSGPIGIHKSAFGVDLTTADVIAKADDATKPSAGRYIAGTALGGYHSLAAGKKGQKLKALGSSVGHQATGYLGGAAAGAALGRGRLIPTALGASAGALAGSARAVHSNQAHGRYKPQS